MNVSIWQSTLKDLNANTKGRFELSVTCLEHHSNIVYLRFWEYIETEWSAFVLFTLIIPMEGAETKLKCNKLLTSEFQFLISLFNSVIFVSLIIMTC